MRLAIMLHSLFVTPALAKQLKVEADDKGDRL
jgi:hypothetical protein